MEKLIITEAGRALLDLSPATPPKPNNLLPPIANPQKENEVPHRHPLPRLNASSLRSLLQNDPLS
jgi:antitoxin (DNA-binding transcriptional repressor) of toxin-antitoxin stability system